MSARVGMFRFVQFIRRSWEKRDRLLFSYMCMSVMVASMCIFLSGTVLFTNLELVTVDLLFQLRPSHASPASKKLVIVEVTADDLQRNGRWPWSRTWSGDLLNDLKDLGAKEILLDFFLSEPSTPSEDNALASAIEKAGNVYLPYVYSSTSLRRVLQPIDLIRQHAKGTGAANVYTDKDGKIRRIPLIYFYGDQMDKSIILQIAEAYLDAKTTKISPYTLTLANEQKTRTIYLTEGNKMLLNWQGKWKDTFRHYSFFDVYDGVRELRGGRTSHIDLSAIKDSVVVVAVTAFGIYDTRPNSLEPEYPGAGIIATGISNIIDENFLRVVPNWLNIMIIYLFALIPPFYILIEKFYRDILMILFVAVSVAVTYILFTRNIVMNFSLPFIALTISYVIISAFHFARVILEKRNLVTLATTDELTGLYNIRYFKEILKTECADAKRDPNHKFYLILCDIDNFKTLNDQHGHQAGDYLIENVAKTIKHSIRAADVAARYGGDEMIVLLRAINLTNACIVAEKIRTNIEHMGLKWGQYDLKITVSVGGACFDPAQDNEAAIIKKADSALYLAKNGGRNQTALI